jgi:hypothetical protein
MFIIQAKKGSKKVAPKNDDPQVPVSAAKPNDSAPTTLKKPPTGAADPIECSPKVICFLLSHNLPFTRVKKKVNQRLFRFLILKFRPQAMMLIPLKKRFYL